MSLRPSLRDVFQGLKRAGHLDEVAESRARSTLEALQRTSTATPWFVKALAGLGAWLSASFILSFFACIGIGTQEVAFILLGIVCCVAATALRRLSTGAFLEQLALALALAGLGIVTAGVALETGEAQPAALANLVVSAALLVAFPDSILRFITTLTLVGAALVLLWNVLGILGVDLGVFVCAALAQGLLLYQPRLAATRMGELLGSLSLGLAACVPALLLVRGSLHFLDAQFWFRFGDSAAPNGPPILTLLLTGLTLYAAWHTMNELDLEPASTAGAGVFAALTLMAVLTLHTPAIIASVGLLLSGFLRRNIVVLGLAVAFLVLSGAWYYYDLRITLLAKSGALVGSGAVLLALRWFLSRRAPHSPATVEAR
ncbi:DUF4401 domain-containing protein [Myxococcus stipitatus]|uniref:DUF4401 domain-containing protein n=1 Tax=Myxococcus stipitatus TaxID=83455 RepID=UPI0031456B61